MDDNRKIHLTTAEILSGLDRVRFAESLILHLHESHEGRNTWLMNYGSPEVARPLRDAWAAGTGRPWVDGDGLVPLYATARPTTAAEHVHTGRVVDAEFHDPQVAHPHPHAAVFNEWLNDTSRPMWLWDFGKWVKVREMDIFSTLDDSIPTKHLAVGDAPTTPPQRMCVLAGVEFPEPMRVAPTANSLCFMPDLTNPSGKADARPFTWNDGQSFMVQCLAHGLVHKTAEGAIAQAEAIHATLKQSIEAAK